MKHLFAIAAFFLLSSVFVLAQSAAVPEPLPELDITGMYSFVHEGEFVQIEVTGGKVTGLVSHYKNEDPDAAEFEDQYFDKASLAGNKLTFTTKVKNGAWFEFSGTVERGPVRKVEEEGYWILHGTLVEHALDKDGKATEKTRELTMKSFPQDAPAAEHKEKK